MQEIKSFRDLFVWQKAHKCVLRIYQLTQSFPSDERFGLTSQIRRAAVSVAANIAEGFKKKGIRDKLNYYNISQGSLEEVRYFVILGHDLGYMKDDNIEKELEEVAKMLESFRSKLESKL